MQEDQSDIFVIFTVTMKILLEPTSNKLLVGDVRDSIWIELMTLDINLVTHRLIFKSIFHSIDEIVIHLRTASAAAKPCQGDSSAFYLITGSIYTDQRGTVVITTIFNEREQRLFHSYMLFKLTLIAGSIKGSKIKILDYKHAEGTAKNSQDNKVLRLEPKPTIPYSSRANKQKLRKKDDNLALKFVEIFRNLYFELSFVDTLLHMPKFVLMLKSLLNNKEKLFDLATTLVNENCSMVILKKLPEKLGDPDKKLSLPELTSTQIILELADRSTTRPSGIAEDVFVKVGKFHFPTDFVVVDYVVEPRVPLILGRPFLRTGRALIDVYGEELTLRVNNKEITFKVGQTSKYSYNDTESINQIDVIDVACEEYIQEV
nr:reverse transcriptase domain-containing protein [Tanacetum cinerariifolium]